MSQQDHRSELLLKMYDQMFNDINRHIIVSWQSVTLVVGTIATLTLIEESLVQADVGVTFVIILATWMLIHFLDASYWYNRNLAIIANIEKQFLTKDDLKNIHYYFGRHRPDNKMISHLAIQSVLATVLVLVSLTNHFISRVWPFISLHPQHFDFLKSLPYLFMVAAVICIFWRRAAYKNKYKEFISNSPGVDIDTTEIAYGPGHGFSTKAPTTPAS